MSICSGERIGLVFIVTFGVALSATVVAAGQPSSSVTGQSTVLFPNREPVGAASISADRDACSLGTEFVLRHAMKEGMFTVWKEVIKTDDVADCRWTITGLRSGRYEASLSSSQGSAGSSEFTVEPQQIIEVAISAPKVHLSGRVTLNEKPSIGWQLSFNRPQGGGHARTTTDDLGTYEVTLDRAGEYHVGISGDGLVEMTGVRVTEGENTRDLAFKKAAVLIARVDGMVPGVPVTAELRETDGSGLFSSRSIESEKNEVKWVLPFGTYNVSARQVSRASDAVTVVLDKEHSESTVTLDLREATSHIVIRDEDGNPVSGAKFYMVFPAPAEVGPGTYSLEGVSPGTHLRIRAGGNLVPACRLAPRNETIDVILRRGHAVTLQYADSNLRSLNPASGSVSAMVGSDCPVPLTAFVNERLQSSDDEPSRFLLRNFPTDEQLLLTTPDQRRVMVASPNGIVNVR